MIGRCTFCKGPLLQLNHRTLRDGDRPFRPFTFAVFADLHLNECQGVERRRIVVEEINRRGDVAFAFVLGDLDPNGPVSETATLMDDLDVPCFMVLGNHEYPDRKEYEAVLGARYYHFDYACYRFIGLDNVVLPDEEDHRGYMDDAQIAWVEQLLEESREADLNLQHLFLFAHVPPHPDGRPSANMTQVPALARRWRRWCHDHAVTACFFGHLHENRDFLAGRTRMLVTPSANWNFPRKDEPLPPGNTDSKLPWAGYRIVRVESDGIDVTYCAMSE